MQASASEEEKVVKRDVGVINCKKSMIDLGSDEEQAGVIELLGMLDDSIAAKYTDYLTRDTLVRFLRARGGNVVKAHKMLTGHLAWRDAYIAEKKAENGGKVGCQLCPDNPLAHSFVAVGLDKKSRPVVYGGPARAADTRVEQTTQHVVHYLEEMFHVYDSEPEEHRHSDRQTWTWIVDFQGFGMKHALNVQQGLSFGDLLSKHYPERLGTLVLLNPPSVFSILLKACSAVVDKRTLDKIVIVKPNNYETFLDDLLPSESKQWVLNAIASEAKPDNLPPVPKSVFIENLVQP